MCFPAKTGGIGSPPAHSTIFNLSEMPVQYVLGYIDNSPDILHKLMCSLLEYIDMPLKIIRENTVYTFQVRDYTF